MGFLLGVFLLSVFRPVLRFNPFQGFGGVSAQSSKPSFVKYDYWFQSLSGFWWGFCAGSQNRDPVRKTEVSIPFRVLVGFLPQLSLRSTTPQISRFNPFQGFGGVSAPFALSRFWTGVKSRFPRIPTTGPILPHHVPPVNGQKIASKPLPISLARIAKDPAATAIRDTPRKGVIHLSKIFLIPACEDRVFPLRV